MAPKKVISAPDDEDGPFGYKTVLGWGVVGVISRAPDPDTDLVGYSHRIMARPLPVNKDKEKLFNNRRLVSNRTLSLRRKLNRDISYREEYTGFRDDMIERGFAEEVDNSTEGTDEPGWYLPHFRVFHKTRHKLILPLLCESGKKTSTK